MEKIQIVTIISLCLFVNASVAAVHLSNYRLSKNASIGAEDCKEEGLMCDDCTHVAFCASDGNGGYTKQIIEECKDSQTCSNAACTTQWNPTCTDIPFACNAVGMFPDQVDCKGYHICYKNEDGENLVYNGKCDGNFGYDMITTFCKTPLPKGCPAAPPVPPCLKAGQSGALTNKSIYYMCALVKNILYPVLYACPNGKLYNGKSCGK